MADEEKEKQEIVEQENNEQKPKPSISPNKDFYYVW